MIVGYARVSSQGQERDGNSLEEQVSALTKAGCARIITETYTGKTMDRPRFRELIQNLSADDTLIITKLDRFARTAVEGVQTIRNLFERNIKVHILNIGLIENTLTGNLILTVMLAFAEYERGMIIERTQTGKTIARKNPSYREGRPNKYGTAQVELALSLLENGKTYSEVVAMTGISKSTLIRIKKKCATACGA